MGLECLEPWISLVFSSYLVTLVLHFLVYVSVQVHPPPIWRSKTNLTRSNWILRIIMSEYSFRSNQIVSYLLSFLRTWERDISALIQRNVELWRRKNKEHLKDNLAPLILTIVEESPFCNSFWFPKCASDAGRGLCEAYTHSSSSRYKFASWLQKNQTKFCNWLRLQNIFIVKTLFWASTLLCYTILN